MTYHFRRYQVPPSPAYPSGVIFRPVIPVWVGAEGHRRLPTLGLLDTGSDDTKLSLSAAERMGATLDRDHPILFRGVGGTAIGFYGEVTLELRQSPRTYLWAARVAFLPDPPNSGPEERFAMTLGHAGFFRHFHVGFDFQRHRVELWPNGLFVGQRA